MTLRHATTAVGLVLGSLLLLASPAEAGGTWPSPIKDRYEAGEVVTIIGYTGMLPGGQYYGWLRVDPDAAYSPQPPPAWPFVHPTDLKVGEVAIDPTPHTGWSAWRASLTFTLPADLAAGEYEIVICNEPCSQGLGDVVGAVIHVGIDPPKPPVRDWPLDDPAIALLEPDAKLWYSPEGSPRSRTVTAADVRAGNLPAPDEMRAQLEDIRDVSIDDTTTTVAPAPPSEDDADLRLTDDDGDGGGSSGAPNSTPWVAAAVGAVLLFLAVRAFGPGRKHVQNGPQRTPTQRDSGQIVRRKARWPRRVVRP